jgi:hypothetical protein
MRLPQHGSKIDFIVSSYCSVASRAARMGLGGAVNGSRKLAKMFICRLPICFISLIWCIEIAEMHLMTFDSNTRTPTLPID